MHESSRWQRWIDVIQRPASQIRGCCRDGTAQLASDRAVQIRAASRSRGNEGFGLSTLRLASHPPMLWVAMSDSDFAV